MKRTNEYEYLNETKDVLKSPKLKPKTISTSNYGTIVEPIQI